jgi:formate--tetrahydrofolate ligase
MHPIRHVAETLGVPSEYLVPYGEYVAKVKLDLLADERFEERGKLIMVTAITPTTHGEGKTVTSIGLAQGIARLGKRVVVTSREPSLGPVFGLKGGATGGGRSRVLPADKINLHFTGDFHAITSAHNLLAALIDAHIFHGNELRFDVNGVTWPRALDMNDRALRRLVVGLGGKVNGVPRESGFVITAASEIMAILALATSRADLRRRLEEIVAGFDVNGQPIRARDLRGTGAMMVLLDDAIMPNLVQTTEGVPAFVHAGPFANIAHGTSSVVSHRMGLRLADYVVNESGFAADLGAEKYFDIVMTSSGLKPSTAVVVATAKALAVHGGGMPGDVEAIRRGFVNLRRHLAIVRTFGVEPVVAINKFPSDAPEALEAIRAFCSETGVESAVADVYTRGGEGAVELAEKVTTAADAARLAGDARPLYPPDLGLEEKIETIAREVYGAGAVHFEAGARRKLKKFTELGYGTAPVCMAKTHSSITDDPKVVGAPEGWTLMVSDAHLSAGAGFVVAVAGAMTLMPGLPKTPQAVHIDIDDEGTVVGMLG